MTAPYQDLVSQLRTAFPAPVSDRLHDAYFVFSFSGRSTRWTT